MGEPLRLGIVSRSFPTLTHSEIAALMAAEGLVVTELCLLSADTNYWVYNGRGDLSTLTDERFAGIVGAYRDARIEVSSLGVFTNIMHPDADELARNLDYFERHMQLAAQEGIPCVATECGFIPGERGVNTDRYEEDFERLRDSLKALSARAKHYGLRLALEPCVIDVVPSAKRMADMLRQVDEESLSVLLDPANLIANSTETEMFDHLSSHVAYFHGKDRKVNDAKGRMVGDGDIDWPLFLSLLHNRCEGLPFIVEYVNLENYREVIARVRRFDTLAQEA